MNKNLISVIIPIFNTETYLDECLTSVLNQSYHALEIILIDDGSTDKSGKKAQEYAEKDKRVQLIRQENQGVVAARKRESKRQQENLSPSWIQMTG